jgi:Flp pilus assembly pilin Flp
MAYVMMLMDVARAAVRDLLARLHVDERGQDTAEYLVMTGVVVAIIATIIWAAYSGALQGLVNKVGNAIDALSF